MDIIRRNTKKVFGSLYIVAGGDSMVLFYRLQERLVIGGISIFDGKWFFTVLHYKDYAGAVVWF